MLSQNEENGSAVVGVDIGGSHVSAALVDLDGGIVLSDSKVRREVNSKDDADTLISIWSEAICNISEKYALKSIRVGIAIPGPFDYEQGVSLIKDQDKFTSLYGKNVRKLLAERLGIDYNNIRLINDGASFLNGEVFTGAAKGCQRAIGLTLGTGLGTAIYKDGMAVDADLWHHPFKKGIAEDYISTGWFVRRYKELNGVHVNGVKELAELSNTDFQAREVFSDFGYNFAEFLSYFIKREDPEVVVLGGNISKAYDLFESELESGLKAVSIEVPIRRTTLGEDACLIGAAGLWTNGKVLYQ